jgi:hypothetical protein
MQTFGGERVYVKIHIFFTMALSVSSELHDPAALPRGKSPIYAFDMRMDVSGNRSERSTEEKILPLLGFELLSLVRPARSQSLYCLR